MFKFSAAAAVIFIMIVGASAATYHGIAVDTAYAIKLDALLAANDWISLGKELLQGDPQLQQQRHIWLDRNITTGKGGMFLPMIVAREMSELSRGAQIAPQDEDTLDKDPRVEAASFAFYVFALLAVDGPRCEDATAPAHNFDLMLRARRNTLQYIKSRPASVQQAAIDAAIRLENRTAALRGPDDAMCRDGLEQARAAMNVGPGTQVPSPPGTYGTTLVLPPVPGWQPKYNPPEIYLPKQAETRAHLDAFLKRLVQ